MKIAYVLSDCSFPPREGLHQQSLELIRHMAVHGHAITVWSSGRSLTDLDRRRMEAELGLTVHRPGRPPTRAGLLDAWAAFLKVPSRPRRWVQEVAAALSEAAPDLIHAEGSLAAIVTLLLPAEIRRRVIVSWVDLGSRRQASLASEAASFRAKVRHSMAVPLFSVLERRIGRASSTWHVVRADEAEILRRAYPWIEVLDIPVMIPAAVERFQCEQREHPHQLSIVVLADLTQGYLRRAFIDFATGIVKDNERLVNTELRILGRSEGDEELHSALGRMPDAHFVPWVDDYLMEIARADIVVLPDMAGSGIKNRTLQAMALGRPVFGGERAFDGVPVTNGEHCVMTSDWASARGDFDELLQSPVLRATLGHAGRELVLEWFSAPAVLQQWEDAYAEVGGLD